MMRILFSVAAASVLLAGCVQPRTQEDVQRGMETTCKYYAYWLERAYVQGTPGQRRDAYDIGRTCADVQDVRWREITGPFNAFALRVRAQRLAESIGAN